MNRFFPAELTILLVIIPSSYLLYQTLKEHLVITPRRYFRGSLFFGALCIPLLSLIAEYFSFMDTRSLIPLFILAFPLFYRAFDLPFWRSLVFFLWGTILMTFPLNFAFIFNALMPPYSHDLILSWDSLLFQAIFVFVMVFLLMSPIRNLDKSIINENRTPENIWFSWLSIPFLFFSLTIAIIPTGLSSVNDVTNIAINLLITICLFLLYIYLTGIFVTFMVEYIHVREYEERQHLIDIQNLQYRNLQKQMDLDRKARHDYKHSLRLLYTLAQNEKWDELKNYTAEIAQASDGYIFKNYSSIPAINAVLNYYMMRAENAKIPALLQVNLPDTLSIPDPEFCNLIGNIMENAIDGCLTLPEEKRKFSISITLNNEVNLFVVSTNTFDETQLKVPLNEGSILNIPSTKHKKTGIGLRSIKETADKYNGTLRLRQENGVFFLDLVMILPAS